MSHFLSETNKTIVQIGDFDILNGRVQVLGSGVILNWGTQSFVITAKHVIEKSKKPSIFVNSKFNNRSIFFNTTKDQWIFHRNGSVDLAGKPLQIRDNVDVRAIDEKDFEYFDDIQIGNDVFYLGFPFNLTPGERLVPVYRKGCIAQKFPNEFEISIGEYRKITFTEKQMIIDAHVSKGNSGCPVFTSPRFKSTRNGTSTGPYLIGIVRSHIESDIKGSYNLKEHSGLGEIYSTDIIVELLNQMIET